MLFALLVPLSQQLVLSRLGGRHAVLDEQIFLIVKGVVKLHRHAALVYERQRVRNLSFVVDVLSLLMADLVPAGVVFRVQEQREGGELVDGPLAEELELL